MDADGNGNLGPGDEATGQQSFDVGGLGSVDPNSVGTNQIGANGEPIKRKRGRRSRAEIERDEALGIGKPSAPRASKAASSKVLEPETLAGGIMMFHMMAAATIPEMAMTQGEAMQLATAMCRYMRHTEFQVSEKTQDLVALIFVLFMVEGTRLIAAVKGVKTKRAVKAMHERAEKMAQGPQITPLNINLPGV